MLSTFELSAALQKAETLHCAHNNDLYMMRRCSRRALGNMMGAHHPMVVSIML
jgi:hypothetical protein